MLDNRYKIPCSWAFTALLGWRLVAGAGRQAWQQARLAIISDMAQYGQRARQLQKTTENLLIVCDRALAAQYTQNCEAQWQQRQSYLGRRV